MIRLSFILLAVALWAGGALAQDSAGNGNFAAFLDVLWRDAKAAGITRATFDLAFDGVTPDPRVIAITRREPEYGKPIGDYIADFASPNRVATGLDKARQWQSTLDAVEKTYGVDRALILALWGMETTYGTSRDKWDAFRSLATLAHAGYRDPYFRNELVVALRILQDKHVPRDGMVSSFAGAMGQPQFMPSSFYKYAVDFTGDGKRDIWTSVPDVLGSIGNYLRGQGWQPGESWGYEVSIPKGFDYRRSRGTFAQWQQLGVQRADGGAFPASGDGILFFPSGAAGPGFVAMRNFDVIKTYNNSDAYALAAAQLAERIRGRPMFRGPWPTNDPQLSRAQRSALQKKLAELGYPIKDFAGRLDFDQRDAVREQQSKFGMVPDGQPTLALLDRLGVAR